MTRDEILSQIDTLESAYRDMERMYRHWSDEAKRSGGESERVAKQQRDAAATEMGEIRERISQLRSRL